MNRLETEFRLICSLWDKINSCNNINSKELFKNLNEIAKEKVNGQIHTNDNGRPQSGR